MIKFGMNYLSNYKHTLLIYIILSFIIGITSLSLPLVSGSIINIITTNKDTAKLFSLCTTFASISIANLVLQLLCQKLYISIQANAAFDLNFHTIKHIQHLPLSYINNQDTIYLNQKINNDSNNIITFIISLINNVLINSITLFFSILCIYYINITIGLILSFLVSFYLLIYIFLKKKLYKMSLIYKESQAHFVSALNEQLINVKFIKIHSLYNKFKDKLQKIYKDFLRKIQNTQMFFYIYGSLDSIIGLVAQISIFILGGIFIINDNLLIGSLTILMSYYQFLIKSVKYFSNLGKEYQDCVVSYNRLLEILNIEKDKNGHKKLKSIESITLKNIQFGYNKDFIINNLSYRFERGKMYGIVGKNGAGKSTLIDLILGLYLEKYNGQILYNSFAIEKIDMLYTRFAQISVIEQEPMLLNDSVGKNLLLTQKHTKASCVNIINSLHFSSFFKNLPYGLNTRINQKSNNVSGGEKQKISIVRQLCKNADLIICDEPTSALDLQSKNNLLKYLRQLKKEKIIIVISHDDKVINYYDEILNL